MDMTTQGIIAVTYDNGSVFQHFGRTEAFKFYTVENKAVTSSEIISTNGVGHEPLAQWLKDHGANVLLCGNMGPGARKALQQAGLPFYCGVQGSCDEAVQAFLEDRLQYNPDATCPGGHHHHHGDGNPDGGQHHAGHDHRCNHT